MANLFKKISQERCPVCGKDKVFSSKGNVLLFKAPQMNKQCSSCNHRYEKEPGYFTGAMYVSYGIGIIEMVLAFILGRIMQLPVEYLVLIVALPIIAFWPFNFRMSRIIWMYVS
ncbi:MAG: DUF983 domain-containing protein [Flammeovirgaceae bacterium]